MQKEEKVGRNERVGGIWNSTTNKDLATTRKDPRGTGVFERKDGRAGTRRHPCKLDNKMMNSVVFTEGTKREGIQSGKAEEKGL